MTALISHLRALMGRPQPEDGRDAVVLAMVRELHRRQQRYDSRPQHWTPLVRMQVQGELIGLRVGLGVALGHKAASPYVVPAALDYYRRWTAAGMPQETPP